MFHPAYHDTVSSGSDLTDLLERLAKVSSRPRYAFMLLTLIAEIANREGSAGPVVRRNGQHALLRDWLCDALTPMGGRDPRRLALVERVREEMRDAQTLPADTAEAERAVDDEVHRRVRASGKTNLSRAVSELVSAGLMRRHYQGYRVDHRNRGAQRHAVYTLTGVSRVLLSKGSPRQSAPGQPRQGQLAL